MATCEGAITTSSANLLHIVLDGSWHIVVDDRLNVTLVDTHRESDRTAQDSDLVGNELLLGVIPLLVSLSSVIG